MSTTPNQPPAPTSSSSSVSGRAGRRLLLSELLGRTAIGPGGQRLGYIRDVIARLRDTGYPMVTGLVGDLGGRLVVLPVDLVSTDHDNNHVALPAAPAELPDFDPKSAARDGEVLLCAEVLAHRLIDIPAARLVRAYDLELAHTPTGWELVGVDTHRSSWWLRTLRRLPGAGALDRVDGIIGQVPGARSGRGDHGSRDFTAFAPLIAHQPTVALRARTAVLGRLKPPQIADLLEAASRTEQNELLDHVHADAELEADVFEELDDDRRSQLLRDRGDTEIAAILTRMRADDAADAITELPQHRCRGVLQLLPTGHAPK